ncbi:hypothetical protein TUST1-10_00110 [Vibrio phage ICP1_2004_A]|jgi:hypothetical protein|nr:hypothetical protein TUST1-191_00115 [Vibrio phage ICP1_2006_D]ADX88296.1 hypothetical protein TUST1-182_00115 [Vibrio phage ICP1_2006_C]ADX88523.1 hypothetical protein TUST1-159_00115 [Vibrio phage ICP1_2006_B]ADX88749.1 hypothetical protein TUST1-17_00115 [Vibrio phage ICP1_2006_A]ADX88975.1 hypothetical protein TUST1-15_00115 [Vibrio phage ICP1_2005_A]ADX89207.1 hypothetical protein TUST1-2_00125 [Vibrio phage ICP1_2001_A]ADX89434.1 hypothetical protein TUST1-10_00110 [Vibrio phage ICP1
MIYRFGDNFLEDANLDGELYLAKNSNLPKQNENCLW